MACFRSTEMPGQAGHDEWGVRYDGWVDRSFASLRMTRQGIYTILFSLGNGLAQGRCNLRP